MAEILSNILHVGENFRHSAPLQLLNCMQPVVTALQTDLIPYCWELMNTCICMYSFMHEMPAEHAIHEYHAPIIHLELRQHSVASNEPHDAMLLSLNSFLFVQ